MVKEKNLCFGCYGEGHVTAECRSRSKCGKDGCQYSYHTLLYKSEKEKTPQTPPSPEDNPAEEKTSASSNRIIANVNQSNDTSSMLWYIPVQIRAVGEKKTVHG